MTKVHEGTARCFVYSYKEGLLSKLAHDLKLEVRTLSLTLGPDGMPTRLTIDPASLELVCQMEHGAEKHASFSPSDRAKILSNLRDDVLETKKHREIVFTFDSIEAAGDAHRVRGTLALHGRTKSLDVTTRREGDLEIAEVTLHQPDFGITPFSAMLGALKVREDVLVRFEVRASA